MNSNYFKNLLLLILTTCTFFEAASQCIVTAYAKNITADFGTSTQTYDVVVEFSNKPATGNLRLRNAITNTTIATIPVSSLGNSTYTFNGMSFDMTLGVPYIYVEFSANLSCPKYFYVPLYSFKSYPSSSTTGTFVATINNGKKYTSSGSDEYVLNYNGKFTLIHNNDYQVSFKESSNDGVEYIFYPCKPDVGVHPFTNKCTIIDSNNNFISYTSSDIAYPNPNMRETGLGNNSPLLNAYPNTFSQNKAWVMPTAIDELLGAFRIPANYFANGAPFSIQYLNQITATTTENCSGGSINFTSLFGGYPEFHASNYTITNNGGGSLSTTSVALNGSFSLTGLTNGAAYNITISDVNGGETILSGTFCTNANTTCSTCATATCPILHTTGTSKTISRNNATTAMSNATTVSEINTNISPGTSKTICVPVTVSANSTTIGFKHAFNLLGTGFCTISDPDIQRSYVLKPANNCGGSAIAPKSTNAQPVPSGFNPEWDVVTTTPGVGELNPGDYIFCITISLNNAAFDCTLLDKLLLVEYQVQPSCTTPAKPTITSSAPTCASAGSSTVSNYNAGYTYTFTPSGPTVGAGGVISDMIVGTAYTLIASISSCNSPVSDSFSNIAALNTPAIPTINSGTPTCNTGETSTISNYNSALTYTFSPSGPTINTSGLVIGMTIGRSYTVKAGNATCTSLASVPFSNAGALTNPDKPKITSGAATCTAPGTSTISNFDINLTYNFSPSGPTVTSEGIVNGMIIGTSYTLIAENGICSSLPSDPFSNAAILSPPAMPSIASGAATCTAAETKTITNYNSGLTYTFNPSGPSIAPSGLISGMTIGTIYTVTAGIGTCTSTVTNPFSNSGALATPTVPTVTTPITYCQDATASALTATGSSLLWYTAPTGGIGSATAPTPNTNTAGNTTYYVSQSLLGCEGPRASITVNVNTTPITPTVVTSVTYCQDAIASVLTATGSNLLWYTVPTGGIGSATAPIPSTTTAGNTLYYVSQSLLGCEGPRASITVTVNATPIPPTVVTPVTYCQNGTASALTATGSSLLWYTASSGGIGSATAPTPSTTVAGNTAYYVSQSILGCVSSRASITVTVNANPNAPTAATPVNYCQDATASALTATGSNLLWYDSINGIGSTIAPTPLTTTIGSTTYYVSQTLSSCESAKTPIVVTISTINISLEAGCIDADYTLTASAPTGTTFEWYQESTLLSNTTNTLVITSPGNYRVVGKRNGCSIDATINAPFVYCEIPKGISPNGDGLNDNFDLSNLKVKHLQIFNRYGMQMYSKSNYKNEWNGYSDSGLNLPDGTYYYIIQFESGKTKTGWVYKNNER